MKLQEMREKRAKLLADMRSLLDSNPNGLSGEQNEQYTRMESDFDKIGSDIARMETLEANERSLETLLRAPMHSSMPGQITNEPNNDSDAEYRAAFFSYIRHGAQGISEKDRSILSKRADLTSGTGNKGGYLVPIMIANQIISGLNAQSYIRQMANVYSTTSTTDIPVDESIPSFGWLGESDTYQQTDLTFGKVVIGAHKTGGIIKVSEELLEDNAFNLEMHLENKIITGFDVVEEQAFLTGDGTGKPTGIVTSASAGVTAASATAITSDEVIDFVYSIPARYRAGSAVIASTAFIKAVRKMKGSDGQYLWQPSLAADRPETLMGRALYESEYMPNIATGTIPAVIANLKYYDVVDRGQMYIQRLVEKYAEAGMVGFRVRKRTEGKLTISSAAKKFVMG